MTKRLTKGLISLRAKINSFRERYMHEATVGEAFDFVDRLLGAGRL
jgi:hypothetical protein